MELKVQSCVHKTRAVALIQRQINPVHALPSHFLKFHFNITIPSRSRSCKQQPSFDFPYQNVCARHVSPPSKHLDSTIVTIFGEEHKLWCCSLLSYFQASFQSLPFLLGSNILLCILLSDVLSAPSWLTDTQPFKQTDQTLDTPTRRSSASKTLGASFLHPLYALWRGG
jgi:hypothetical protein